MCQSLRRLHVNGVKIRPFLAVYLIETKYSFMMSAISSFSNDSPLRHMTPVQAE